MKKLILILPIIFTLSSFSQLKQGYHLVGATVGFSSKTSTIILGGNYEFTMPQSGVGLFSAGALTRYWSASEELSDKSGKYDYTNVAVAGQLNFHFNQIGSGKFVPFVGLVLGFNNVGSKYTAFNSNSVIGYEQKYKNGLFMWGQGGCRYFVNKKVGAVMRLGLGNFDLSTVELGFDYKF